MAEIRVGEIDLVDEATLDELRTHRGSVCVSLLLPTHTAGPQTQQDRIRLSNLVRSAERALVDDGLLAQSDAQDLLAPARRLLDDRDFWRFQSHGLAVYVGAGFMRTVRVPLPLSEELSVGPAFRLRPLLRLVSGDGHFFLLALSQNEVRLFEGTRSTMAELPLGPIPPTMADALAHEDPEAQLQVRAGGQAGMYHGHGVGDEVDKQAVERFFRAVDRGLSARIGADPSPLVLAAVAYYLPIYRSVTSHPALADRCVEGSPEGRSALELHQPAWAIAQPLCASARRVALDQLEAARGTDRVTSDVAVVTTAARAGRVQTLVLGGDEPCWGRVDDTGVVTVRDARAAGDEDLLELAALATLRAGGAVFVDGGDAIPGGGQAAALLRW